jgi:hypothetical protein
MNNTEKIEKAQKGAESRGNVTDGSTGSVGYYNEYSI